MKKTYDAPDIVSDDVVSAKGFFSLPLDLDGQPVVQ
jgi:hypothetical protein